MPRTHPERTGDFPQRRSGTLDLDAGALGNDVRTASGGVGVRSRHAAVWPGCGRECLGPSREHAIEGQRVAAPDGRPTPARVRTGRSIFPRQFLQERAAARRAPRLTVSTGRSGCPAQRTRSSPGKTAHWRVAVAVLQQQLDFPVEERQLLELDAGPHEQVVCQLFCLRYWTSTAATGRSVPSRKVLGLLSSTPIWLDQGLRSSGLPGRCTHRPVDAESGGELVREAEVYGLVARIDPLDAVVDANSSPRCEL
jgi:hypothetical protein